MAIRKIFIVLFMNCNFLMASLQDPFPQGFSMGNMGAILWDDGAQGRQPWIPSAFYKKNRCFGLACGAVSYYDKMDNFSDESIFKAFGGAYFAVKKLRCKIAVSHFSALEIYYEQSGFLSCGIDLFPHLVISTELTGSRIGLVGSDEQAYRTGECGFSGWIPFKFAAIAFSINHIVLKSAYADGVNPPVSIKTGIHTVRNRFGAQGVVLEVTPTIKHPIRFILGEQYRFLRLFAIDASISNNPFMFGIGITAEIKTVSTSVSLVNHAVLGWSRGFAVLY